KPVYLIYWVQPNLTAPPGLPSVPRSTSSSSSDPAAASRPRKVTQKDVAIAANVSQTLVSLVFSDAPSEEISQSSRRKIIEAAQKLGYQKRKKEVPAKKSRKVL